jgi:hypothetical protein
MKNGWELIIVCGADEHETTDFDTFDAAIRAFAIARKTYIIKPYRALLLQWVHGVPKILREFDSE